MSQEFDNVVFSTVFNVMEDKFHYVLEKYLENAQKYIANIKQAYSKALIDQIKDAAHPLASSSASLGFIGLAGIAKAIEDIAKKSDNISESENRILAENIEKLDSVLARVKDFVANYSFDEDVSDIAQPIDGPVDNLECEERKKIRIMHIDDDPVICKITKGYLNNSKCFEIMSFLSVEEALVNASFAPDIILVDFMMPDMEGMLSLLNLKTDPRLANVPVIFVTGIDQNEVQQELGDTISGYIKKPYKRDELISKIMNVYEHYHK